LRSTASSQPGGEVELAQAGEVPTEEPCGDLGERVGREVVRPLVEVPEPLRDDVRGELTNAGRVLIHDFEILSLEARPAAETGRASRLTAG
jgi:hypothetical protein